jgi:hypothetical protein
MPGPNREWVTIPARTKERKRYQFDVTWLTSRWACIFGNGCQGVFTEPAAELVHGCCSYGAHASERGDRDHVELVAKKLRDDEWQFKAIARKRGIWAKVGKDEWRTRLVDDACIFLNRVGFDAGPGCALHLLALRKGVHFSETKPTVCWQLPIRTVEREEDDDSTTVVVTEFGRDGWGEGGEEFAWWCTEAPEAFVGEEPVYRSLEPELRKIVGDEVFDELALYLDARVKTNTLVGHPAEVPVTFRTRHHPIHG